MPGSVTISHTDALVMLAHDDARRLSVMLGEMSRMLGESGSDRLTDPQVGALAEGQAHQREELTAWCRKLSGYLADHL
ncbi:hypothetical protein [Kitasatospora sp. NPDC059571]|uniref:hypothetical protein n=1 Tax=Kitasatospora sp. NPDC059571 TaxID=3346871 RepID=UPI0036957759